MVPLWLYVAGGDNWFLPPYNQGEPVIAIGFVSFYPYNGAYHIKFDEAMRLGHYQVSTTQLLS